MVRAVKEPRCVCNPASSFGDKAENLRKLVVHTLSLTGECQGAAAISKHCFFVGTYALELALCEAHNRQADEHYARKTR